jgi:hypothetical protein
VVISRYWANVCSACALKDQCTTGKERRISRWQHEHLAEDMQRRLDENPEYAFFLCDTSCDWKINGKLKAERSTHSVGYSDGQSHVTVTYAMQPDVVEPY